MFLNAIKNLVDFITPAKRKRRDDGLQDHAEPPPKRPSAGEAPPWPAAGALPGRMSQPSAAAFVSLSKYNWMKTPVPGAATPSRARGGSGPTARRFQQDPQAVPIPEPKQEAELRVPVAAQRRWPPAAPPAPSQPSITHLSPEEKARYDWDSYHALKSLQPEAAAAGGAIAPAQAQQAFMKKIEEFKRGMQDPQTGAHLRDAVGLGEEGPSPVRAGRTVGEEADLAKAKAMQHTRDAKAVLHRASVMVREAQERGRKNKEKEDELKREIQRMEALKLKAVKVPEITDEDRSRYEQLTTAAETAVLVCHPRSKIDIKGHDMRTLKPGAWLNDEVINLCISLLQERDLRRREEGAGAPTCHFFSSFFLNKLYKDSKKYNYNEVRRWTLAVRLKNAGQASASILDCDRIIIPANQGNTHWVCAMVDLKNQKFVLFDSLGGEDRECLKNLAQYVKDEFKNKKNEERDDILSWPHEFPKNIPHQTNGYDCGMFTILFAEYCGKDAALNFSQEDIDDFRIRVVRDIMRLKID